MSNLIENSRSTLDFKRNRIYLLLFQIQYNIIVRTGSRTYPRYFRVEFAFRRAAYQARPLTIDLMKLELQAKVVELRSKGWSFPAIAIRLDISVGTVWNLARH
jgi:hypothetical protein